MDNSKHVLLFASSDNDEGEKSVELAWLIDLSIEEISRQIIGAIIVAASEERTELDGLRVEWGEEYMAVNNQNLDGIVRLARALAEATIPVQVGLSNPEFEQKIASKNFGERKQEGARGLAIGL